MMQVGESDSQRGGTSKSLSEAEGNLALLITVKYEPYLTFKLQTQDLSCA